MFIIPANTWLAGRGGSGKVKNGEDRLVVMNSVARSVVDGCRGDDSVRVFTFRGLPVKSMYNTAWKRARRAAALPHVRIHDLKHTHGRRLRAAGVALETRRVLLGHKSGDITTHYSAPELEDLIAASERVCDSKAAPNLVVLKAPIEGHGVRTNSVHRNLRSAR